MKQSYHFLFIFLLVCFTTKLYSQSVPSYVPTNGLVGWWGFNGNAQDGSGNGNHGTIVGSITNTTDRFGIANSALFFNGNDCHIPLPTLNTLPYRPISYSAWVIVNSYFPITFGHKFRAIAGRNTAGVGDCGVIGFWSDGGYPSSQQNTFLMWRGGGSTGSPPLAATSPPLNQWVHVVYTQEINGDWKWYMNGALSNSGNFTDPMNYFSEFRIGGCNNYNCSWNDKLDDIGIWNRALSPQEITNLYNAQNPQPCTTSITNNINISGCGFTVLSSGDTVNQSGTYIDTLLNSMGCDSILYQIVTIQNPSICNPVPSYVPTNGLVGWWGFNGNSQDGSGNGNHGTVNGATLTTDRFGNQNGAYLYSQSLNNIVTPQCFNASNNFSLSGWVYSTSTQSTQAIFATIPHTVIGFGLNPWWAGQGKIGFLFGNGSSWINGNNPNGYSNYYFLNPNIYLNEWVLHTIVKSGLTYFFYQNGILYHTYSTSIHPSGVLSNLVFGNGTPPLQEALIGKIDDIGIWNRALTQQEITNLYTSQLPTQTSLCLPSITTNTPTSIGIDSAIVGGNITNDGGSSIVLRGVCYSTTPNPNMGNMRTEDGSGVGSFSTILRNLNPSTTYYVRSYAKNSNGVVVYGDEVSFSTTTNLFVGASHAGGIIFYLDSTGQHGLVCAPTNQNSTPHQVWANSICEDLILNGYSDWYLPDFNHFQLMYNNLHLQNIGEFTGNYIPFYWTTLRCLNSKFALFDFWGAYMNCNYPGSSYFQVRAIRSF